MKPKVINPKETTRYVGALVNRQAKWKNFIYFRFGRTMLKISFQFHHTQMDGAHAGKFLELLQKNIDNIGRKKEKK